MASAIHTIREHLEGRGYLTKIGGDHTLVYAVNNIGPKSSIEVKENSNEGVVNVRFNGGSQTPVESTLQLNKLMEQHLTNGQAAERSL